MKIHIKLIGENTIDNIYDATIEDNKIRYMEGNVDVCITKYSDYIEILRKCNEYTITLNLKKGQNVSYYHVFGSPKQFCLNTDVTKYKVTDKKIEIDYDLEGNKFKFLLEVIF